VSLHKEIKTMKLLFTAVMLSLGLGLSAATQAVELNNEEAIAKTEEIKVIYDMRKANPNLLLVYLKGIESNRMNLEKEGVARIEQRIVFIADAVKYITTKPSDEVAIEYGDLLPQIAAQVARLQQQGVKMEVCGAATAAFKVDNATLLPGIKAVRSGFLSVMGWQKQGYQLVPVYN